MQRFSPFKGAGAFVFALGALAACTFCGARGSAQQKGTDSATQQLIPSKVVEFKAVETDSNFTMPSTTIDYPHCLSGGALVLRSVDWDALKKAPKGTFPKYNEIVTIIRHKTATTLKSTNISDLTDFNVTDIFPTDSGVYFLLQGTKEKPGERGPGTSPAGIPWRAYRNFVARFDLDGTYRGVTELGVKCDFSRPGQCELSHFAVFPSGDMLVTESDPATSTLKVLYLKSSGEILKQIDVPASRRPLDWGDEYSNPEVRQAAKTYLSSVFLTAVGQNIIVWRANSNDAVVEIHDGGGVREVPLQIPDGYRMADMVASNDRWVVHFRTENTPPTARMREDTDKYFDVRPQDGSLSAKIMQKGEIPLSIACEVNGKYMSFKMNEAGKMVQLEGN